MVNHKIRNVGVGHSEAKVGFVVAILRHRFGECHLRETTVGVLQKKIDAGDFFPNFENKAFDRSKDVILINE